jgi:hypothetical protein
MAYYPITEREVIFKPDPPIQKLTQGKSGSVGHFQIRLSIETEDDGIKFYS